MAQNYMEKLEDRWHGGWAKGMSDWFQRITPKKIDKEAVRRIISKLATERDEEEWHEHLVSKLGGLTPRQVMESSLTPEELKEIGAPEKLVELKRKQGKGKLGKEKAKEEITKRAKKKLKSTV